MRTLKLFVMFFVTVCASFAAGKTANMPAWCNDCIALEPMTAKGPAQAIVDTNAAQGTNLRISQWAQMRNNHGDYIPKDTRYLRETQWFLEREAVHVTPPIVVYVDTPEAAEHRAWKNEPGPEPKLSADISTESIKLLNRTQNLLDRAMKQLQKYENLSSFQKAENKAMSLENIRLKAFLTSLENEVQVLHRENALIKKNNAQFQGLLLLIATLNLIAAVYAIIKPQTHLRSSETKPQPTKPADAPATPSLSTQNNLPQSLVQILTWELKDLQGVHTDPDNPNLTILGETTPGEIVIVCKSDITSNVKNKIWGVLEATSECYVVEIKKDKHRGTDTLIIRPAELAGTDS